MTNIIVGTVQFGVRYGINNSILLTLVITIVAAFVSYKLVEQPVLKMKQTRKERIIIQ
ncbi:MAG: hypothetical protein V4539_10750 [Bacteroidota bacterium]